MNDRRPAACPMPASLAVEPLAVRGGALSLLLLAAGAQAQSPNCERLKTTLAARMDASGVHGYTLDAVPAKTAQPPGSKVIGTCDGGAVKVLYRRSGGAAATPTPTRAPAPVAATAPPPAEPAPAPAAAPVVQAAAAAVPAAAPEPSPAPAPAALPAPSAPAPVEVRTSEPATAAPVTKPEDSLAAGASLGSRVRGALDDGLHWAWGLLLLPLLAWLWAWQRHRSLYDEAGLPRGPKLR